MFASLLGGLGIKGMVIIAAVAAIGILFAALGIERARARQLEAANAVQAAQLDEAGRVNAENVKVLEQYQEQIQHEQRILADERERSAALNAKISTLAQAVSHAKAKDDGPVAPVLRAALNGLRASSATH